MTKKKYGRERLTELAEQVYGSNAQKWLNTYNKQLDGVPSDLIQQNRGKEVRKYLKVTLAGVLQT